MSERGWEADKISFGGALRTFHTVVSLDSIRCFETPILAKFHRNFPTGLCQRFTAGGCGDVAALTGLSESAMDQEAPRPPRAKVFSLMVFPCPVPGKECFNVMR